MVRGIRHHMPRIGAKKLHIMLSESLGMMGIQIGRVAFANLLCENDIVVRRKRSKMRSTFSQHRYFKYPNLIRNFTPLGPNELWVSDITYIQVGNGFIYLSLITDAYSHKIVGWNLARDLAAINTIKALEMALSTLTGKKHSLIHHSDRGVQYCCDAYVALLEKNNIAISMTEKGDPLENAIAERVNGILKIEWIYDAHFNSFKEAQKYIEHIIGLYNSKRPHQSISYLTPDKVHYNNSNDLNNHINPERKWKNYYKKRTELVNSEEYAKFEKNM